MKDPRIEKWLESEGVPYRYEETMLLHSFNADASWKNQARLGVTSMLPELIERYALAMMDGAEFPAVICYRGKRGHIIISGNHRLEAARVAEKASLDAYVVEHDDEAVIKALTQTANILEGAAPTVGEIVQMAKSFQREYGWTVAEVARRFRLKRKTLERSLRADSTTLRLIKLSVDTGSISESSRSRMGVIKSNPVLQEVGRLISEADLKDREVVEMTRDLKDVHSEQDELKVVSKWRDRPDIQERIARKKSGRPARHQTQKTRLMSYLESVKSMLKRADTLSELELTSKDDRLKVMSTVNEIVHLLKEKYDEAGNEIQAEAV